MRARPQLLQQDLERPPLGKRLECDENATQPEAAKMAVKWFEARFNQVLAETNDNIDKYRLSDALMAIYKLTWDDFCSWYLEMVKAPQGQGIDPVTYAATIQFFEHLMLMLHPFMPFITEEIWHAIAERKDGDDIIIAQQPKAQEVNKETIDQYAFAQELVNNIRAERSKLSLPFREKIEIEIDDSENEGWREILCVVDKLCNISYKFGKDERIGYTFMAFATPIGIVNDSFDADAEIKKLEEELKYYQGFLMSVTNKLANERFVNGAPAAVVEKERKKKTDTESKIAIIEQQLASLRK